MSSRLIGALSRSALRRRPSTSVAIPTCTWRIVAGSRSYTAAAVEDNDEYVSPLQSLFDRMEANAPSSIPATEYVRAPEKHLKCGIPESALRFTTTAYGRTLMAPHVHPKEHQVIMKVDSSKLPLNEIEKDILREIVGPRLNDERNELRLTSNQFGSRIENKRHLVSMLDRIVLSCQRLAKEIELDAKREEI